MADNIIKINVGGLSFETKTSTLARYPDTLLGRLSQKSKFYDNKRKCYFFDRNPNIFVSILDLYRTGSLHFPAYLCGTIVQDELEFWEISPGLLGECCFEQYLKSEGDMNSTRTLIETFERYSLDYTDEECRASKRKRILRKVWLLLEEPSSSKLAKVSLFFSLSLSLSLEMSM